MKTKTNGVVGERLAFSISETARALSISRSNCYDLISRGLLPSRRLRGRLLVPRQALLEWLTGADSGGTTDNRSEG
ncbi:MAG: helix-turn-helix domain-containing protein [Armatimonadetes bacterium]|nr:helix-turn-helix domain-containing protein [Armatimonadota bacterium]